MNIKVAAFTVSEKSSNTGVVISFSMHNLLAGVADLTGSNSHVVTWFHTLIGSGHKYIYNLYLSLKPDVYTFPIIIQQPQCVERC